MFERTGEMRRIAAWTLAAMMVLVAVASAHEVTYEGTVVALQAAKYAQPDGSSLEVQELEVAIVDEETKRSADRVFTILTSTRVLRGGESVTLAAAAIQKGDAVEVVSAHDIPGDEAIEVRLVTGG